MGQNISPQSRSTLGDDLYSRQALCELILQHQLNFILVCKPTSHKFLYEWLQGMLIDTLSRNYWRGKFSEFFDDWRALIH